MQNGGGGRDGGGSKKMTAVQGGKRLAHKVGRFKDAVRVPRIRPDGNSKLAGSRTEDFRLNAGQRLCTMPGLTKNA